MPDRIVDERARAGIDHWRRDELTTEPRGSGSWRVTVGEWSPTGTWPAVGECRVSVSRLLSVPGFDPFVRLRELSAAL